MFVPHKKHTFLPPRPIRGWRYFLYMLSMFVPHRKHLWAFTSCFVLHSFTFLYGYDARTLQETHLWPSTVCYMHSFTIFYMYTMCSPHMKYLWTSTVCYGDSFTFPHYISDAVFIPTFITAGPWYDCASRTTDSSLFRCIVVLFFGARCWQPESVNNTCSSGRPLALGRGGMFTELHNASVIDATLCYHCSVRRWFVLLRINLRHMCASACY
jgi:hypothetical protein